MPPKIKAKKVKKKLRNEPDTEVFLKREYDMLTDSCNALRRRAAELRHENEILQNEAEQMRLETQEFGAYISQVNEERRSAIVKLDEQHQEMLEKLKKQRETQMAKYTEQADELKRKIMEKKMELALLKSEVTKIKESEEVQQQQQQLARIAELQKQKADMQRRFSKDLHDLKAHCLQKQKEYEKFAKQLVHTFTVAANKEASRCLAAHIQNVIQENQQLREELQQLIRKAHALRQHHSRLKAQKQQLMLEKECLQALQQLRLSPGSEVCPAEEKHEKL